MSQKVQRRRGTTAQHSVFAGAVGETTVDTDKNTVVVHDGSTLGGFPLARASSLFVSPLTTKGDVHTHDASVDARLGVGANGQVLTADSTQATGIKWATPSGGGGSSPLTTKGDIWTFAGADARQAIGANGTVPLADSTKANGWDWEPVSALPDQTAYLKTDGTRALTGDQSFGTHKGTNLATPTASADAATKGYVDSGDTTAVTTAEAYTDAQLTSYLKKDGSVAMTGALNVNSHKVSNVTDPTLAQDASTKAYTDTGDALALPKSLVTTKGDVIAATASATPARLGVGADGTILMADAASTPGVKWSAQSGITHANLSGLSADDHTQYTKADGTRAFTGDQSMGSHKVTNVTDPTSAQDAATKAYADLFLKRDGTNAMTASLDAGTHKLINVTDPAAAQDAATKNYCDVNFIIKTGATAFTGDQSMGSHKLTSVTDPTSAQDAATKNYVDTSGYDVSAYRQVGVSPLECWYTAAMNGGGSALTTGAPAINTLIAMAFVERRGGTLNAFGFNVTTVGGAGSKAMMGIYKATSNTNLYPGSKVATGTEFDTSSGGGTGLKTTSSTVTLTANTLYWFVYVCGTAAPTIRAMNTGNVDTRILGYDNTEGGTPNLGLTVARTYDSTLPSTFTAGATFLTAVPIPALFVRYAS